MQNRAIWLLALATIVVSVGTSAVVATALAPPARVTTAQTPGNGALVRELATLRAFLEQREASELQSSAAALATRRLAGETEHPLAGGDVERLIGAIERLEASMRTEQEAMRSALAEASTRGLATRENRTEIEWGAWSEIWNLYQSDERAARNRVRLLTTDQLLARYGLPSEVVGSTWIYFEPDENGPLNVQLQIVDGYVSNMWMEA